MSEHDSSYRTVHLRWPLRHNSGVTLTTDLFEVIETVTDFVTSNHPRAQVRSADTQTLGKIRLHSLEYYKLNNEDALIGSIIFAYLCHEGWEPYSSQIENMGGDHPLTYQSHSLRRDVSKDTMR